MSSHLEDECPITLAKDGDTRHNHYDKWWFIRDAFDKTPDLKLMLLMHVSNQHGLVLPVARIVEEAGKRGIDVICDTCGSCGITFGSALPTTSSITWPGTCRTSNR